MAGSYLARLFDVGFKTVAGSQHKMADLAGNVVMITNVASY